MPEELVKQHYIALAKLLKHYRLGPLHRDLLKATHNFCKRLYISIKAHPDLIFAQPQLYKSQLPYLLNLTFNSTVLSCLFAVRNKLDTAVSLQVMSGSISHYALAQLSIDNHYQNDNPKQKLATKTIGPTNSKFMQLLQTNQQTIWLSTYVVCCKLHMTQYPATSLNTPVKALAYMANKLALLCTPNKSAAPLSFAGAINILSLQICSKWYRLLVPLVKYPSLTPPGSYIQLQGGSIHIVLSLNLNQLVTQAIPVKSTGGAASNPVKIHLTSAQQIVKSYACQPITRFARLNNWWGDDFLKWLSQHTLQQKDAFDPLESISVPPASLLVIQDQLNQKNADMPVIVKAIEKEPAYTQQLQVSATLSNRKKQPVQNTQQALAMLGFERTSSLFLQQSLLSRLNQQYFPVQQALLSFSQFFVFTVSELAKRTKVTSPELAGTAAYFMISRLFTLPTMRSLLKWQTSTAPSFSIASLVHLNETKNIKHDGLLLAKAWQQNQQILEVLHHYDLVLEQTKMKPNNRKFCFLLGLSLSLAQEFYFCGKTRCKNTQHYLEAGLAELDLSQSEVNNMMMDICVSASLHCQID